MKQRRLLYILLTVLVPMPLAAILMYGQTSDLAYLGEDRPTMVPKIFAPDVISLEGVSEFGSVFNREGTEFFYGVDLNGRSEIRYTRLQDVKWTLPAPLLSNERVSYNDPFLSPDGNRLYFISNYSSEGKMPKGDFDILYIKRNNEGWGRVIHNVGSNINSERDEYYMSFDAEGTMYFSSNVNAAKDQKQDFDILSSRFIDGVFKHSILLGDAINTDAYEADVFVALDASYMIFCAVRENGYGKGDLYISFRDENGHWSKAVNMGKVINTGLHELCPFVTWDGKYLFFTRDNEIYWVDAAIIDQIKSQTGKGQSDKSKQ